MATHPLRSRLVPVVALFASVAAASGACSAESEPDAERPSPGVVGAMEPTSAAVERVEALRRHLVRVAGDDLRSEVERWVPAIPAGEGATFVRADDRIEVVPPRDAVSATLAPGHVVLPTDATGPIELRDGASGASIRFALRGARRAPIEIADGVALYRGGAPGGGDVVQRPTAEGVEDHLELPDAPRGERVVYDVDVSALDGLRLVGNVLEMYAGGRAALRVSPPRIVGADGASHDAGLSVEGCAVDTSPSAFGVFHPVVPGAKSCAVVVSWSPEARFGCARADGSDDCAAVLYPALLDPYWNTTTAMAVPRDYFGGAYVMGDGVFVSSKAYAVGGADAVGGTLASVELLDMEASPPTWTTLPPLTTARQGPVVVSAAKCPRILVAGGFNGAAIASAEVMGYIVNNPSWTPVGNLPGGARRDAQGAELPSGKTMVFGGFAGSAVAVTDVLTITSPCGAPLTFGWAAGPVMKKARLGAAHVVLNDGRVFVAGGLTAGNVADNTGETYNEATNAWTLTANTLPNGVFRNKAALLPNGKVLETGGANSNAANRTIYADAVVYDPATNAFSGVPAMSVPRELHVLVTLTGGRVLAAGGRSGDAVANYLTSSDVFDGTLTWTAGGPMSTAHALGHGAADEYGHGYAFGGLNSPTTVTKVNDRFTLVANGAACPAPKFLCDSAVCADGVCCDQACTAPCENCATGTCTGCAVGKSCDVPNDVCKKNNAQPCAAGAECLSGFCVDGVCCGTACTAQCKSCGTGACATNVGKYAEDANSSPACNGPLSCNGAGVCTKDDGQACGANAECTSGICVDGTCCNVACNGTCLSCANPQGTCTTLVAKFVEDPNSGCTGVKSCNGAGACTKDSGQACGANAECTSGFCVDGTCCGSACTTPCLSCANPAGTCTTPIPNGVEDVNSSPACTGTASCNGAGACTLDAGQACNDSGECTSGFCVDKRCCGSACNGNCQSCSAATNGVGDGVCAPALANTDPHGTCPDDGVDNCDKNGQCDGAGQCQTYAAGAVCKPPSCNGTTPLTSACDGAGTCVDTAGQDCGANPCVSGACASSCVVDGDCAANAFCKAGTCTIKVADGTVCGGANECASDHCVDGLCCDTACDGQCEACDVGGSVGICTPVVGAPHGARPACAAPPPGEPCAATTCDGQTRATCEGHVGASVACRAGACVDGVQTLSASCDGKGACPTAQTKTCEPFACAGDVCGDACSADAECATGYRCVGGKCTTGATCDGDHTLALPDDTSRDCSPYRCTPEGTCRESCASTAECVSGDVCSAAGQCVPKSGGAAADEGGCGCRVAGGRDGPEPLGALGLALALVAARRRRTRLAARAAAGDVAP